MRLSLCDLGNVSGHDLDTTSAQLSDLVCEPPRHGTPPPHPPIDQRELLSSVSLPLPRANKTPRDCPRPRNERTTDVPHAWASVCHCGSQARATTQPLCSFLPPGKHHAKDALRGGHAISSRASRARSCGSNNPAVPPHGPSTDGPVFSPLGCLRSPAPARV